MSEFDNYDSEYQTEDSDTRNPLRARMKQLEKENAEAKRQLAEAEAARRELAFVKAGIDLTSPASKYFVKGYDGELSPEAIRDAAVEAQLISPPVAPSQTEEAQAWNRTAKIAAGSQTAQPPVDWAKRLELASSPKEVEQILAEARTVLQNP
jgi:hypothetical protein